jgi:hypothetical protein
MYWGTHHPLFLVLANVVAWINLFNLLPALGLDGAKAVLALSAMQRGLLAATCLVFFVLTLGPTMTFEHAQWVFLIVGAGLIWKTITRDTPEHGDTGTFVYFQGLIVALGLGLVYTVPLVARYNLAVN